VLHWVCTSEHTNKGALYVYRQTNTVMAIAPAGPAAGSAAGVGQVDELLHLVAARILGRYRGKCNQTGRIEDPPG
jgi:hypothetical protein